MPKKAATPSSSGDLLATEIAQEKAAALGRQGRALEAALAALSQFDASHADHQSANTQPARHKRAKLVAEAGRALWHLIVQREALGLRDSRQVMRDYRVPSDVRACMGVFPSQPAS